MSIDLTTKYMGLELKNPLVVAFCNSLLIDLTGQVNLKFQYSMTKTFPGGFCLDIRILVIGICLIFGA